MTVFPETPFPFHLTFKAAFGIIFIRIDNPSQDPQERNHTMACFLVPLAEAVITSVVTKIVEKKEKDPVSVEVSFNGEIPEKAEKIPFSKKLKWLNMMLLGGSLLLAFEHVWHGEVVPFFPFLTAASNPADAAEMFGEMSTVGVAMAALVTAVWAVMLVLSRVIEKRALKSGRKTAAER